MSRGASGSTAVATGPAWTFAPPPKRPGFGREGREISLYANHFAAQCAVQEVTLVSSSSAQLYDSYPTDDN